MGAGAGAAAFAGAGAFAGGVAGGVAGVVAGGVAGVVVGRVAGSALRFLLFFASPGGQLFLSPAAPGSQGLCFPFYAFVELAEVESYEVLDAAAVQTNLEGHAVAVVKPLLHVAPSCVAGG